MQVIDKGHKYQLLDGQEIRFLKKEKNPLTNTFDTVWVGTTNEELLEVLIDRTTNLNAKMHSAENDVAIFRMQQALTVFQARTAARMLQNVEATPEQHQSAQAIVDEAKRIVQGGKMRSILHIKMGEDRAFTPEEMSAVVKAFQNAELDPIGGIVATNGVPLEAIQSEVGGEEIPYAEPLLRYLRDGIEGLTTQEMINLEAHFAWTAYKRSNPDSDKAKTKVQEDGQDGPINESLIGAHDASAFSEGVDSSDRAAAMEEVMRQQPLGSPVPTAAWPFPASPTDSRNVTSKVADDMSGKINWQGGSDEFDKKQPE